MSGFQEFSDALWSDGAGPYPEGLPGEKLKRQWIGDRRWGYDAMDVWRLPDGSHVGVEVLVLAGDEGDVVVRDVFPVAGFSSVEWRRPDD